MSAVLFTLTLALLIDRVVGDPPGLWRRVPHPVALFGALIARLDRGWNREGHPARRRRVLGVLALAVLLLAAAVIGWVLASLFETLGPAGLVLEAIVASVFLAQGSLALHVRAVRDALGQSLDEGRRAVSMIVGRDPSELDRAAVARAAIESLAENASDGVVAPVLAFLAGGLPGLLAYKMLNTADSMIGHLSERHRESGWATARLDDAANFVPARLTALLFAAVAPRRGEALAAARRDGPQHRSVNAGWPEAAMAGALGLALGGPRRYGELEVAAPMLNAPGRREATVEDIDRALAMFASLCTVLLAAAATAGLAVSFL